MPLRLSRVMSWASAKAMAAPQWGQSGWAPLLSAEGGHRPLFGADPTVPWGRRSCAWTSRQQSQAGFPPAVAATRAPVCVWAHGRS